MQAQGFCSLMPFEPFNRMGFLEVIAHLSFFLNAKKYLIRQMKERRPHCVVCVDYPGLNMPLMKEAHKLGIPVVWYIAPMVWAWKKKRASVLGRYASHIACIFPFEVKHFSPFTNKVSFVGNPLVEAMELERGKKRERDDKRIILAIVPGSRKQEVEKMLPLMVDAYKILKSRYPSLTGKISCCGSVPPYMYDNVIKNTDLELVSGALRDLLRESHLALVTSGTATLETALMGIPLVIGYRTSLVTYSIFKSLVKISYIGLPNIIAGEQIVPECIQGEADCSSMAEKLQDYIENRDIYEKTENRLLALRQLLGSQKPSLAVARIINDVISSAQIVVNPNIGNSH